MQCLADVHKEVAPLRNALVDHKIYRAIKSVDDLRVFMQFHVHAVWDFMSLLKALQVRLTCVRVPWVPSPAASTFTRLINEIVLAEESDVLPDGTCTSHFDLYLNAMRQCGADTDQILDVVSRISDGADWQEAFVWAGAPDAVTQFVRSTFGFIATNKSHVIASAFTLGREELIPDMFSELVRSLDRDLKPKTALFCEYLDRHIDLDSGSHGPLSEQLLVALCGDDRGKWSDVAEAATAALQARLQLWDAACAAIEQRIAVKMLAGVAS